MGNKKENKVIQSPEIFGKYFIKEKGNRYYVNKEFFENMRSLSTFDGWINSVFLFADDQGQIYQAYPLKNGNYSVLKRAFLSGKQLLADDPDKDMLLKRLGVEYEKLLNQHPELEDPEKNLILEQNSWWLKSFLKFEDGYDIDSSRMDKEIRDLLKISYIPEFAPSPENQLVLEKYEKFRGLWEKKKLFEKYSKVTDFLQKKPDDYGLKKLLEGHHLNLMQNIENLVKKLNLEELMYWSSEVILPKGLLNRRPLLNYPGRRKVPPPSDTLRILYDGIISVFAPCFNEKLLEKVFEKSDWDIFDYDNGYAKFTTGNFYYNLVLDLCHNHVCRFYITINETLKTIDFAFKQKFMHGKYWKWKFEKLGKHWKKHLKKDHITFYYNKTRQLARRINKFLGKVSERDGYQYRTFPNKFNP